MPWSERLETGRQAPPHQHNTYNYTARVMGTTTTECHHHWLSDCPQNIIITTRDCVLRFFKRVDSSRDDIVGRNVLRETFTVFISLPSHHSISLNHLMLLKYT